MRDGTTQRVPGTYRFRRRNDDGSIGEPITNLTPHRVSCCSKCGADCVRLNKHWVCPTCPTLTVKEGVEVAVSDVFRNRAARRRA